MAWNSTTYWVTLRLLDQHYQLAGVISHPRQAQQRHATNHLFNWMEFIEKFMYKKGKIKTHPGPSSPLNHYSSMPTSWKPLGMKFLA